MSESQIKPFQVHIICRSDFEFSDQPKIIHTIGADLFKTINYETEQDLTSNDENSQLQETSYALALFPKDKSKLVIGNESGLAEIFTAQNFKQPFPIMEFISPVHFLKVSANELYIAGCSKEPSFTIYNLKLNKPYRPKPSHDSSLLHIEFNSSVTFFCSTACDGMAHIYSIAKMEENPLNCLVKTMKISKETRLDSPQILRFDWHPSNNIVALPGSQQLQLLSENENGDWSFSLDSQIHHHSAISAVCWNSDGSKLLTFCVDKVFKLWNYAQKELIRFANFDQDIYCLKYSAAHQMFGFTTHQGYFAVWKETELGECVGSNFLKQFEKESISKDEEARLIAEAEMEMEERSRSLGQSFCNEANKKKEEDAMIEEHSMEFRQAEERVEREMRRMPVGGYADIIDTGAQPILYPSSTKKRNGTKILSWNLTGMILRSEEGVLPVIDVDFTNKSFHLNVRIYDNFGITMGVLNEKGIVLASRAEEVQIDEYEDEFKEENAKYSNIIFRPLNCLVDKEQEWAFPLPEGENVDTLAIGNNWIAAITDINFIRFLSFKGLEMHILSLEKPVVCCAGYESLLAIVYHDSPPFLGCQSIKLKVISVENYNTIFDGACVISPNSTLKWFGFSDNGMILTQDSRGIIRAFVGYQQWRPIYRPDESKKNSNIWLIGMDQYELIGVSVARADSEPSITPKPTIKTFPMRFPSVKENDKETETYAEILKRQLILDHERFRSKHWMNLRLMREKTDNLFHISENILDAGGFMHAETKIEKMTVNMFQEYLIHNEYERALILASTLKASKPLQVCLHLCQQLGADQIVEKIRNLFDARTRIEAIEQRERNENSSRDIVIIKPSEDRILPERPKVKKGLASYAVSLPHHLRGRGGNEDEDDKENDQLNNIFDYLEEEHGKRTFGGVSQEPSVIMNKRSEVTTQETIKITLPSREESEKRGQATLFQTFGKQLGGVTHTNPLKRKAENEMPRNDLKRFK